MADPTVTDVVAYSQGRLEEDARTTALLAGSLAAARTYCGWHVIGEKTESITVNGPGTNLLVLPTTRLAEITALQAGKTGALIGFAAEAGAMIAGAEIELPSLGGMFMHALEAGPAEPRQLRLPGKGYPGRGRSKAGDLVVELEPVFPQKLNARQRKLLLQANAALMDEMVETLPEIAAWRVAHGID